MQDDTDTKTKPGNGGFRGLLASFLLVLARDAMKLLVAFALGTGAGAIACWYYYGIPLVFSVLGGILVLELALPLATDSLFS